MLQDICKVKTKTNAYNSDFDNIILHNAHTLEWIDQPTFIYQIDTK